MAPGARRKFGAPMFETEVFQKQMYCIEGSTCDIVGTFRRPRSHSAPPTVIWRPDSDSARRELRTPCPPRYPPAGHKQRTWIRRNTFWCTVSSKMVLKTMYHCNCVRRRQNVNFKIFFLNSQQWPQQYPWRASTFSKKFSLELVVFLSRCSYWCTFEENHTIRFIQ